MRKQFSLVWSSFGWVKFNSKFFINLLYAKHQKDKEWIKKSPSLFSRNLPREGIICVHIKIIQRNSITGIQWNFLDFTECSNAAP